MGDPDACLVFDIMGEDVVYAKDLDSSSKFLLLSVWYFPTCDIMHNHTFQPAPLTADFKIFAT